MSELDIQSQQGAQQRYQNAWNQYYNQAYDKGTESQNGARAALEKEHRHPDSLDTTRWAMARESQALLSGSKNWWDAFLQFWVNPSECQWHVPLRSAIAKTSGGAVHYEIQQLDRYLLANFTRLDLPTLTISFQSGIIMPGGYNHIDNGDIPNVMPHGLANFYDFIDLLDQPNLTDDGLPNFVNINYVSPMHGTLWLRGFFSEEGVAWSDSSENPNQINSWGATFIVCTCNPPLNSLRSGYSPNVSKQNQPRSGAGGGNRGVAVAVPATGVFT